MTVRGGAAAEKIVTKSDDRYKASTVAAPWRGGSSALLYRRNDSGEG